MKYYSDLKNGESHHSDDEDAAEKRANLLHMNLLQKAYQVSLPTFASQENNELFLSELHFTDEMAEGLSEYLTAVKMATHRRVKGLSVYNCNMSDKQLALILQGINS